MGVETIATVVVSMAVGTVVGKIVEKVTGSSILGSIVGAAAGFGASSLMAAGSTAAADTLAANEALTPGTDAAFSSATGNGSAVLNEAGNALVNGPSAGLDAIYGNAPGIGAANVLADGAAPLGAVDPLAGAGVGDSITNAGRASTQGLFGDVGAGAAKGAAATGAQAGGQALSQGAGAVAQGAAPSFWQDPLASLKGLFTGMDPLTKYGMINAGSQMLSGFSQGQLLEEQNKRADRVGKYGLPMDGSANGSQDPVVAGLQRIQAPTRPGGGPVVQATQPGLLNVTTLGNVSTGTNLMDRIASTNNALMQRAGLA